MKWRHIVRDAAVYGSGRGGLLLGERRANIWLWLSRFAIAVAVAAATATIENDILPALYLHCCHARLLFHGCVTVSPLSERSRHNRCSLLL